MSEILESQINSQEIEFKANFKYLKHLVEEFKQHVAQIKLIALSALVL